MEKRSVVWAMIAVATVASMACSSSGTGARTAPAVTSSALQPTIEAAQVNQYLAGIQARQTLDALDAMATATAAAAQATAMQREWEATATAQAQQATATAAAWQTTVEASAAMATATAQAQQATATAATQERQAQQRATATAWAQSAEATAQAWRIQATREAADAERTRMALEREKIVQPLVTWGPWALAIAALALIGWGIIVAIRALEVRARMIQRDQRGDAPLMVLRNPDGSVVIVDPDRAFGPATVLDGGVVTQPALVAPELQERVTARDQAVDLASRGLPQAQRPRVSPAQAARVLAAPDGEPKRALTSVRIVDPGEVRGWLGEVEPLALTASIESEE